VVGALPQGLPGFKITPISLDEFRTLCSGATAIALVSIADMSVLSRIYAARGNYYVDANQELVALGVANVATGFLQGFPVSSSSSRTPVAESAGSKTQVTGLVGAASIVLLLLFAPRLLYYLPIAALGAVVISVCTSIIEIKEVRRLFQLSRAEFVLSMICFLGVAVLGVVQGIFISVGLALAGFIWRAWRPYAAILGRVDGLKGYHDISRHPEAHRIPGLVLFRWDAPLFFANAEIFREQVLKAATEAPTTTSWLVVAAEPVTDIDITAADMLAELDNELLQAGITLCFAQMKGPVKDRLKSYDLFCKLGQENFFPTIGQAVDHYLQQHQVAWIDWEDRVISDTTHDAL
jgi:MFS superfamily sulfate permease-like transporter